MKTPNDDVNTDPFAFENEELQAMHDDLAPLIEKIRASSLSDRSRNDIVGALYGLRVTLRQADVREKRRE